MGSQVQDEFTVLVTGFQVCVTDRSDFSSLHIPDDADGAAPSLSGLNIPSTRRGKSQSLCRNTSRR